MRKLSAFILLVLGLGYSGCGLLWFGAGAATGAAAEKQSTKKDVVVTQPAQTTQTSETP